MPTKTIAHYGREAGNPTESKKTIIKYENDPIIISVNPNNYSPLWDNGAIIENLIIDGLNAANTIGIHLKNVCNCYIRNLTIRNCDTGIKIELNNYESFANRFEHIRMVNVKTGILFTSTNGKTNFHYTTIDDVNISLNGNSDATGIKIGDSGANAKLYSTFIKANVDLGSTGGKGLQVNGELKYSIVNLEVKRTANTGIGILVNSTGVVKDNQSFLLTANGFGQSSSITNNGVCDSSVTVVAP